MGKREWLLLNDKICLSIQLIWLTILYKGEMLSLHLAMLRGYSLLYTHELLLTQLGDSHGMTEIEAMSTT